MATDYLNKNGLSYFWTKLKAFFAFKNHTHNAFDVKHSYTTAANAAKNWYRIANANTSQTDTTKPIHAQFILTAYNTSYAANYYERWFVNASVFGGTAQITILGNTSVPFNQARILYENTVADIDANDRPALDIYLNYVLPNGTTKIEVEEVYNNGGWTFLVDGQLAASTVPSGFENVACGVRGNGVERSTYADYVSYLNRQISSFTAAFTLADTWLYRSRTLNCTGTFTITVPSINSGYMWCVIKNKNASSGVITLHPSTTSVLIDGSNADITLQPMEYVCIHSAGANNYSLIADGRWKSQKADKATSLSGYGITDAKIANGTITLGSNTITPLTSSSSLNAAKLTGTASVNTTGNAATVTGTAGTSALAWNTEVTLATIGGNAVKAKLPANPNTNTTYTFATGDSNGQIKVTPSGGSAQNVDVKGLGTAAYTASTAYAAASHNQASNTINAMTGYSKPNATSAITTGDTLNQAIGKLEKAIDDADISNVVHRTGDEVVQGIKSFTNLYNDSTRPGEENIETSSVYIRMQGYNKGDAVSYNKYANLIFLDQSGTNVNWNGRLGQIETVVAPSGAHSTSVVAFKNEIVGGVDTVDSAVMRVGYDAAGIKVATCPSTSPLRTSGANDIVTRDWIPQDTRIVHTSNAELIFGQKTFANPTSFRVAANNCLRFVNLNVTSPNYPSSNEYQGMTFYDSTEEKVLANIYTRFQSDRSAIVLNTHRVSDTEDTVQFSLTKMSTGEAFMTGPTPASVSDDSGKIPTTEWVRDATGNFACNAATATKLATARTLYARLDTAYDSSNPVQFDGSAGKALPVYGTLSVANGGTGSSTKNFVDLSTTQTVGGVKSFTSSPEVTNSAPRLYMNDSDHTKNSSSTVPYASLTAGDKNGTVCGAIAFHCYGNTARNPCYSFMLYDPTESSADTARTINFRWQRTNTSTDIVQFMPGVTALFNLGAASLRWKQLYISESAVSTSDERLKESIAPLPDDVLDAWEDAGFCQYRMRSAVAEKGAAARLHAGLIAQRVRDAFALRGLDASRYGFFCWDEWEADEEEGVPAGDQYSLRYVEALCMEAAYMRRENARLKARVASLEERLAALEMKLS